MKQTVKTSFVAFSVLLTLGIIVGCAKRPTIKKEETIVAQVVEEPTPVPYMTPTPIPPLPTPVPTSVPNSYIIQPGDSLWRVSGDPAVFGDSFRWPLLFKANRDQIIDPDLIEPAQDLTWKHYYARPDVEDAISKAKDTPPYVPHNRPRKQLPLKY